MARELRALDEVVRALGGVRSASELGAVLDEQRDMARRFRSA